MTTPDPQTDRSLLRRSTRVVIKVGSACLTTLQEGISEEQITRLADQISMLKDRGCEVALVSSGSVAAGVSQLGMKRRPTELADIQAAAAVGQCRLMHSYAKAFGTHGLTVGQMLLTRDGLDERLRYLNARNTLTALLERGAVPIINENDTVMVEELQFGDNDQLSSMVASMAEADLLILLSDVDGLHEKPPAAGESPVISTVTTIDASIEALAGGSHSGVSRGGMASKLSAAKRATDFGTHVVLANGQETDVLERIHNGERLGTWFRAKDNAVSAFKQWLAARKPSGAVVVDEGAARALTERGKSLLPIGASRVEGVFHAGDTIAIRTDAGQELGIGISNFNSDELGQVLRRRSDELPGVLGYACATTVIHRDNLVLSR
ncbi:MAG: glutamate 5-kinase [Planctomycetota bacterium]|jgi:glutamate 5-kinase